MSVIEGDEQARSTADAVARRSYGKLVAFLAARTGDVAAAEDALSEAFAAALKDWPQQGCPSNPEGWLLTVARRKNIDRIRAQRHEEPAADRLQTIAEGSEGADEIPDRRLGLMFACAHPAIDESIRAPLILQAVLGLDAKTIASAFLASPAAMSKRLVRAKEKIRQAAIPLRIPDRDELPQRLAAVLDAIYATFSEGWADPQGTDATRRDFTEEALFLGRLTAELLPREPEPLGLLALMLHAEARRRARRTPDGEYVPLAEQDPALWDAQMISTRSRSAIGARRSLPQRPPQLARSPATLRRAAGSHRLPGHSHQPSPGSGRSIRSHQGARSFGSGSRQLVHQGLPTLLGSQRRVALKNRSQ